MHWRFSNSTSLALGLLIIGSLPLAQASANGLHAESSEVFSGTAGHFDIKVLSSSLVGSVHVSVYVSEPDSLTPVSDANVHIIATGPRDNEQTVGPVYGRLSPASWYSMNLPIDEAGDWTLALVIQNPSGEAAVNIPIDVRERAGINWVVAVAMAVFLGVAAWSAFSWRRGPGGNPSHQNQRRGTPQNKPAESHCAVNGVSQ